MYVSDDHRDWDNALPFVTFAYNSSRHDTAGYSPFYLLYGRDPILPFDTVLPIAQDSTSEYARDVIATAEQARQIAHHRLSISQSKQKSTYDSRHRDANFLPGDLVLLWSPSRRVGLSEKLMSRYAGPYRVLRQVTDVTYEISPVTTPACSAQAPRDVVHVGRLKRYQSSST